MQRCEPSRSPANRNEIAQLITPCLTLVAPVGMDEDAQIAWFAAAFMALEGYSGSEIERGARAAMRKADHPSKVVPLIVKEIEALGEYSRDTLARPHSISETIALPRKDVLAEDERQEVGALMKGLVRQLESKV